MKRITNLLFLFLFVTTLVAAQNPETSIFKLKAQTNAQVAVNLSTGVAEFVRFPMDKPLNLQGNTLEQKVAEFLNNYKSIYHIESINTQLEVDRIKTDNYGLKHVILKQKHNGVPVFDGQLRFHFNKDEKLTAINGNYIPSIKTNATPTLNQEQANAIARSTIENQNINFSGEPLFINKSTLYVFAKGLVQGYVAQHNLVFEVEVRNDLDVREYIFVDAHNGTIVEQFTGIAHAMDRIVYEETTATVVWQEGDAFPGSLTIWQQNEVEASAHMYHFFENAFGYTSYDDADAQMRTINNNPNIACPNANWNGATANYCDGTASDDVIAHEWGHAYTEYTSGLIYAYQSGAMNESYSDIWGETIDILNNYGTDDNTLRIACASSDRWRMGEDATAFGSPIRDMWDPTCNNHPGKVTDGNYRCGAGDSGGVHSNSGVPNHAYALLVDGGTYNGQTINPIGFTKAAHIFFRAQSEYLTATSDFANLADALEAACSDLLGINLEGLSTINSPAGPSGEIITAADCQEVTKAILAVELRINPDSCGYQPVLAASEPLCDAATTGQIFFEDWEAGIGSWTLEEIPSNPATWTPRNWEIVGSLPDGRSGKAAFGTDPINGDCNTDLENGIIRLQSPVITIPDIQTGTFDMAFNHYVSTEANWDGGNLKYSLDGTNWALVPGTSFTTNTYNGALNASDNPIGGEEAFTGSDEGSTAGSWGQSVVDISSLGVTANSTVQFRWDFGTDGCNGRIGWYLDEVVVYNCSTPTLSVAEFGGLNNAIKVYPNPSNGLFTLQKVSGFNLVKAEVYDINGRTIKTIDLRNMSNEIEVDISEASSGVYFMSIITEDTKGVIKLIKN